MLETLIGFLIVCLSGALLGYLYNRAGAVKGWICACMPLVVFCCPLVTEQLYFNMQIVEIAVSYLTVVIAVGLSYYGIYRESIFSKIGAVLCMVWAFSSYQTFTIVYVAIVVFVYILLYYRCTFVENRKLGTRKHWIIIGELIGLFSAGMLVNFIITKLWFDRNSYLDSLVYWNFFQPKDCLSNIFTHIKDAIAGLNPFYTSFYGIFAALTIVLVLLQCKRLAHHFIYILAAIGLQLCPFLLTFYMGGAPAYRTQLVYSIVLACDIVFCIHVVYFRSWWKKFVIILLAIVCIWGRVGNTARLIYSDDIRIQEDIRLANALESRISIISSEEKPIAFVGAYNNRLNRSCIRGEIIGLSIFACNYNATPYYYISSTRICDFVRQLGIQFLPITPEQMLEARASALNLPVWPAEGSVVDAGEYVIVKLGEDLWPEEVAHMAQQ